MADLEYTVRDGIATILLNRPERKNAFTIDMVNTWADKLIEAQHDPEVRVIVLTGAGGSFCSGVDLSAFKGRSARRSARRNSSPGTCTGSRLPWKTSTSR